MVETFTEGQELEKKLREILQNWPLYRELKYTGAENITGLPSVVRLYCDNCKNYQIWERTGRPIKQGAFPPGTKFELDRPGKKIAHYQCRNCTYYEVSFYYHWIKENDEWRFYKAGQYPRSDERVDPELQKQLAGEDLDFYKNAVRLRNFNLGIGSLSYLRRVVENRMNDLLDVLAEEAKQDSFAHEELKKIGEVKTSWRFSDKIKYASSIIPPRLRPDGHNPLDLLYGLSSEGIHAKPEDECIEIFDKSRRAFEYFFKSFKVGQQEWEAFRQSVIELTKKAPEEPS